MNIYEKIHHSAIRAARASRKTDHELLSAIGQVDRKRVYQRFGYKNLHEYCIKCLKLEEGRTYAMIRIARRSIEIPEMNSAIAEGNLSISSAKTILSVITPKNKEEWITKAKTLSVRDLEKEVVKEKPELAVRNSMRPVSENRIKLQCGIEAQVAKLLERAQDLLSQKTGKAVNLEDTLTVLITDFVKQNDPLEKPEKVSTWKITKSVTPRKQIQILQRDKGACQAKDPMGKICGQARWLDIHHILPVSEGGKHEQENLITLCRDHHRMAHEHLMAKANGQVPSRPDPSQNLNPSSARQQKPPHQRQSQWPRPAH